MTVKCELVQIYQQYWPFRLVDSADLYTNIYAYIYIFRLILILNIINAK